MRGRKIRYSGDPRTRPMKDRVREAAFNLIGPHVVGKHAIDLFAGTGAMGLEAISRGAARATLIERHLPTARVIQQNTAHLGIADLAEVAGTDAMMWVQQNRDAGEDPWLVFCCPPYDFYVTRTNEMLTLIGTLLERAPNSSIFLLEADHRFDFSRLPRADAWDVRTYRPSVLALIRLPAAVDSD